MECQNSIILILSDHGIGVGEKIGERAYGAFCYDYTLKTFAYLYNPDINPKKISSQVRHIDFMPTILEMLDIPINTSFEKLDGKSLMPVINGQNLSEEYAFSETGNPLNENAPPKVSDPFVVLGALYVHVDVYIIRRLQFGSDPFGEIHLRCRKNGFYDWI